MTVPRRALGYAQIDQIDLVKQNRLKQTKSIVSMSGTDHFHTLSFSHTQNLKPVLKDFAFRFYVLPSSSSRLSFTDARQKRFG